jgi:tetratricopeptide (TPR) repeat protein
MPRQKSTHVDDPKAVGLRLKEARERTGLSQRQLAFSGCSPAYISRIEAGDRIPSLQLLRELGHRLGVSEDYLATGERGDNHSSALLDADLARRLDDPVRAAAAYEALLAETNDARMRSRALEGLGHVALREGDPRHAIQYLEEALQVAGDREPERPAVAESLGRAYATLGEFAPAIAILERCAEAASDRGEIAQNIRFSCLLASALIDSGNLNRAEQVLARALAEGNAVADPMSRARLYWSQSTLLGERGDAEGAAGYAYRALSLVEMTEDVNTLGLAHQLVAYIELDRGRPEEALDHIEQGRPLVEATGTPIQRAHFRIEEARALARLGRKEEAAGLAMELTGLLGDALPEDAGRTFALLAEIFVELGEPARAQELYELAAEYLKRNNPNRHLTDVYGKLAELHEAQGRKEQAFEYMKLALAMQKAVGARSTTSAETAGFSEASISL